MHTLTQHLETTWASRALALAEVAAIGLLMGLGVIVVTGWPL